jgi:hypothetical protein
VTRERIVIATSGFVVSRTTSENGTWPVSWNGALIVPLNSPRVPVAGCACRMPSTRTSTVAPGVKPSPLMTMFSRSFSAAPADT